MSTQPVPPARESDDAAQQRRKEARLRAAACRARLATATDALAAADLLLAMNFSIGSCGREPQR
jgi:hypothetical protein